jgi:PST family polysaccharide transporter
MATTSNQDMPPDELLNEAVRRGGWTNLQTTIASQVLSVATLAVLYRLLQPEDYGLFALCFLASNLARVLAERGLLVAAIQAPTLNTDQQSALWWRGLGTAAIAAMGLAALGAVVESSGFGRNATVVLGTLGLSLVVASFGWQHQVGMERDLQFARLAGNRFAGQLVGSVAAIALAWFGGGAWSLAVQQFAECAALSALLWWQVNWRPLSKRKSTADIQHFVTFGNHYATSSLFFWLAQNADTLLVGLVCGKQVLGFYSQAYNLAMKPISLVTVPVSNLMLPAISRAAATPDAVARLAISFFGFLALWLFPAAVGVWLLADEIMHVLGGSQWHDAAPILMAFVGMIASQGLINLCGSLLAAVGRADLLRKSSIVIATFHVLGFVVAWQIGRSLRADPMTVAWAIALSWTLVCIVVLVPYLLICCRSSGIAAPTLFTKLVGIAISAAIMGSVVWLIQSRLTGVSALATLAICAAVGLGVYSVLQFRTMLALAKSLQNRDRATSE